jgi:dephospho-CoA kinase
MCFVGHSWAQDTTLSFENKTFTLADVIIRNNFEYKDILARIKRVC